MSREGDQTHQPPAELHAPALGSYYLGPQQRPLTPPLVQSVQYFYNPGGNIGNKPLDHNVNEGVIVKALPYIRRHCKGRETTEFWVWNQFLEKVDTFKYLDNMVYF